MQLLSTSQSFMSGFSATAGSCFRGGGEARKTHCTLAAQKQTVDCSRPGVVEARLTIK